MATISPLEWLGIAMATRAKQQQDRLAGQAEYERNLVNQRLTPYGGNIGQYQDVWERGFTPQQTAAKAQSQQMYDYWMGLPKVLTDAAAERRASGGSGGGSTQTGPSSRSFSYEDYLRMLGLGSQTNVPAGSYQRTGSADTALAQAGERISGGPSFKPEQPRRAVRPIRGAF